MKVLTFTYDIKVQKYNKVYYLMKVYYLIKAHDYPAFVLSSLYKISFIMNCIYF